MSLSNPRQVNPASKFIEWSGSKGQFKYYDKEKEENIFFEDDIYMIPLDELNTIKGYDDHNQCGIYSNEVKYLSKEILHVRSFKGGTIAKGIYGNLKLSSGCKFAKSIYAVLLTKDKEETKLELVNFQLYGSSIGSWIDAKINIDSGNPIKLSPSTDKLTKGTTEYFAPKISILKLREDILQKCIDIDKELQIYLKGYLVQEQANEESVENKVETIEEKSQEEIAAEKYMKETDKKIDDFNDIDDLPF